MQNTTKPVAGATSQKIIETINEQVKECQIVLESRITKLIVIVGGFKDREIISKVFNFPAGTVPEKEIMQFFQEYATRISGEAFAMKAGISLIRIGSDVISLVDFIKDYTAGDFPSMNAEDAGKLLEMLPGEYCIVQVNNTAVNVQRIN